jgi:hypothetical protein
MGKGEGGCMTGPSGIVLLALVLWILKAVIA